MRRYETIFIINPSVGEDEITAIIDKTTSIIEEFDGSIVNLDHWGLKKLAYPIKKELQGYYVFAEYAGKPEAVAEVERIFKIDDRILKFMTIKTQDVFVADAPKAEAENTEATEEEAQADA
ncbi:MAG: 30S ribosomal protein S6 [Desulfobulbaceae bacterium]|nr:30S ribosomal protein S6 [Desulfobulbaceae bacterium]